MAKVEVPETRYARNGPVNLAYQVVGDGPIDVLWMSGGVSHLDYLWQYPPRVHFIERLAAFSRLVLYDKRGSGLSDRTVDPPTTIPAVSDAVAILDELGIEHAHVFGHNGGGSVALALTAAHPDRVAKVAVYGAICCAVATEDFPWAIDPGDAERWASSRESRWGGTGMLRLDAPNYADDPDLARWQTAMNRAAVSPAGAATWARNYMEIDIRPILASVAAPALVLNRPDVQAAIHHPGQARYLAEHLPDACHVELPGQDHMMWVGDSDAITDEVQEFFTGTRPTRAPARALATVMFTDIVNSTGRAAGLGDSAWRDLLQRHDDRTRRHVEAHDGRVVKSTGDGALATFDDPDHAITASQDLIADLHTSDLDIRVGIHSGQIEITGDDVAGLGVHIAARINNLAQPGEVLVSRTVRDLLLGSDLTFTDRGTHELKGVPGPWEVLSVTSV